MHTFLLRVWSFDVGCPQAELHGVLEMAGSAEPRPFRNDAELLSLLKAGLQEAGVDEGQREREER